MEGTNERLPARCYLSNHGRLLLFCTKQANATCTQQQHATHLSPQLAGCDHEAEMLMPLRREITGPRK